MNHRSLRTIILAAVGYIATACNTSTIDPTQFQEVATTRLSAEYYCKKEHKGLDLSSHDGLSALIDSDKKDDVYIVCNDKTEVAQLSTGKKGVWYIYTGDKKTKPTQELKPNTPYKDIIEAAVVGKKYVDAVYLAALLGIESNNDPNAISWKGATGPGQWMPESAVKYGLCKGYDKKTNQCTGWDHRKDPTKAIPASAQYLEDLTVQFEKYTYKREFATASYNGGATVIKKAIGYTNKTDPTWLEVSKAIRSSDTASYRPAPYVLTKSKKHITPVPKNYRLKKGERIVDERKLKVKEIQEYVPKIQKRMEELRK
ncbi:MAG: transglycosylase SLT domain-containing protein [Candidatus Woesearchaeota archaeon]|jgi:hypothetical protein